MLNKPMTRFMGQENKSPNNCCTFLKGGCIVRSTTQPVPLHYCRIEQGEFTPTVKPL